MSKITLHKNEIVMICLVCWQGARSIDNALPPIPTTEYSTSVWHEMQNYLARESRSYMLNILELLKPTEVIAEQFGPSDYDAEAKQLLHTSFSRLSFRVKKIWHHRKDAYKINDRTAAYIYYCVRKLLNIVDGGTLTNIEAILLRQNLTRCVHLINRNAAVVNEEDIVRVRCFGALFADKYRPIQELVGTL